MSETIFEKSQLEQQAFSLPQSDPAFEKFFPDPRFSRKLSLLLPEISELDLTRHFSELARKNVGIDNLFYPLGSCTMKFNPRVNEYCAKMIPFLNSHPLAEDEMVQGNLEIIERLLQLLISLTGMTAGSLLPNAGAQGEFAGIQMIAAYHLARKAFKRNEILIPDDAHGTNPATAAMAGFKVCSVRTSINGDLDIAHLKELISEKTAGLMLTNPNTLGLFSPRILEIAKIIHDKGGLLFYDGANLNPILNIARPGTMGFDVIHLNLHKTFSTPHGGGGPGSGALLCNDTLKDFLPLPHIKSGKIIWSDGKSIGMIASFFGNFSIHLRAYVYLLLLGSAGLRRVAQNAVLNANYLKVKIGKYLKIPYPQFCMHEFVVQTDAFLDKGIKANDIAKRMLDYGVHPPTVYFPLIVKECLLIEPTECESKATLDRFIEIIKKIIQEIQENPDLVKTAPHTLSTTRLNEVEAAKHLILKDPSINF